MLHTLVKKRVKNEEGQALVEFALVLPILLLILCGIIDFGWLFYNQYNVDNAARAAARQVCVECATESEEQVLEDAIKIVKGNIHQEETLPESDGVVVVYLDALGNEVSSNNATPTMVRVDVKINMPIFTFVLQTICQSKVRVVSASATYKIESGTEVESASGQSP